MTARSTARSLVAALVFVSAGVFAPTTLALDDPSPPTGTFGYPAYDPVADELVIRTSFTDPESGVTSLATSCEGGPEVVRPYATTVRLPARDPAGGGCPGFGVMSLVVRIINGSGSSTDRAFSVDLLPIVTFEYPLPPRTGERFTIRPMYSAGFVRPPDAACTWEFRWGSTAALRDNDHDETFGAMGFAGPASQGFCDEWTFTLPWVPLPQFEVNFEMRSDVGIVPQTVRSGSWPDRELIHAAVVGTDRRIRESNLPVAQVLPSTYTPVVGQSITYTRYLIAGASSCCRPEWNAWIGEDAPFHRYQSGGATFTVTPTIVGNLLVQWQPVDRDYLLYASYDPPVRRKDTVAPNTNAPHLRFAPGGSDARVPVEISWSGTDTGWGIASYRLERSVGGGGWTKVALPSARTTKIVQSLVYGVSHRYRVRAVDKAGNTGAWDYGAAFKPRRTSDQHAAVTYSSGWESVADPTAHGGVVHETGSGGRSVSFTFSGRAIAWIAERGPTFGKARVYIDGVLIKMVDTGQAADQPRRLVFRKSWSTVGTHRIRIVVSGTAGRPTISLDGFAILR